MKKEYRQINHRHHTMHLDCVLAIVELINVIQLKVGFAIMAYLNKGVGHPSPRLT